MPIYLVRFLSMVGMSFKKSARNCGVKIVRAGHFSNLGNWLICRLEISLFTDISFLLFVDYLVGDSGDNLLDIVGSDFQLSASGSQCQVDEKKV